ncbi:hypothetical protein L7F22_018805 [Adiantum nelumboides]|nr:hypothetical protein [Adiantum nelumboides]
MMVTGDHPAQCKIGCFKEGGQSFCRRCKAIARLDGEGGGRYVYDDNMYQFWYLPSKRHVEDSIGAILEYERVSVEAHRESILEEGGLSGVSSLWRLYDLYGFDPHIDLVYDCMHILSLNMFSKYISALMKSLSNKGKRMVDDAIERLSKGVPAHVRYGRWPRFPSEVKEIPKDLFDVGLLVIDICHAFINFTRENGWSLEDIEVVRSLLASWRVQMEELFGINSAPLEHVAGFGDILDNILHHGSHDVIWCYLYEGMSLPTFSSTVVEKEKVINGVKIDRFLMEINHLDGIHEYQDKAVNESKLDNSDDNDSFGKVLKAVNESKLDDSDDNDSFGEVLKIQSFSTEDMEPILLAYTHKKTVNDMYFSLRKMYVSFKKEESSFKNYSKGLKNPDSQSMMMQIIKWLMDRKRLVIHGCSPLSTKDIEIV